MCELTFLGLRKPKTLLHLVKPFFWKVCVMFFFVVIAFIAKIISLGSPSGSYLVDHDGNAATPKVDRDQQKRIYLLFRKWFTVTWSMGVDGPWSLCTTIKQVWKVIFV